MADDVSTERRQPGRVTVTYGRDGWEVSQEREDGVVHRASYTDWHRVERAVGVLGLDPTLVVPPANPHPPVGPSRLDGSDQ